MELVNGLYVSAIARAAAGRREDEPWAEIDAPTTRRCYGNGRSAGADAVAVPAARG